MAVTRRETMTGAAVLATAVALPLRAAPIRERWLGAWGTALTRAPDAVALPAGARLGRSVVPSLSGTALRIRLSNELGDEALTLASVTVAERPATFGGASQILIPAGAAVVSDPVVLPVKAGAALAIAVTLPVGGKAGSIERTADRKGGWLEVSGTRQDAMPALVSTVDVRMAMSKPVLAILSDTKSAGPGTWPALLTGLAADRLGVVNRSVFGGLLALGAPGASALARFDRDVLGTSGVTHALIFAGNNDLIQPGMIGASGKPTLDPALMQTGPQLIALLDQAVRRAHAAGLVAVGGTWLPYEGVTIAQGYSTPEKLRLRDEVNAWIRKPGSFDLVIDFDAVLHDSAHPTRLAANYDSGNHFTPNDAGYRAMAQTAMKALLR